MSGDRYADLGQRNTNVNGDEERSQSHPPSEMAVDNNDDFSSNACSLRGNSEQIDTVNTHADENGHDDTSSAHTISTIDTCRVSSNSVAPETQAQPPVWKPWNPLWLRRPFLFGIFVIFVCMMISISILFSKSQTNHGIVSQTDKSQYSWTYGPTAFLVIIMTFWRRIDHACKVFLPWQELEAGASLQNSLLLDYVSPMMPVGLWNSCRNRHWAVTTSITMFVLLNFAEVLSSGLLVLQPTKITHQPVSFSQPARFTAETFDITAVNDFPLKAFQGIRKYNLPYPDGMSEGLVVEYFKQRLTTKEDFAITANVNGFTPNFECEAVRTSRALSVRGTDLDSEFASDLVVNVTTPSCRIENAIVARGGARREEVPPSGITHVYQGFFQDISCNDTASNSLQGVPPTLEVDDHRILMTVADLHWSVPPNNDHPPEASAVAFYDYFVQDISAVLCKSSYHLDRYAVSFQHRGSVLSMDAKVINNTRSKLGNITDADISKALAIARQKSNGTQTAIDGQPNTLFEEIDPYLELIMAVSNQSSLQPYIQPDSLKTAGRDTLNGVATILANEYFMQPYIHNSLVVGSITYEEERLILKPLTACLMLAIVALLSIACLFEIIFRPKVRVPKATGSISSLVSILSSSKELNSQLTGLSLWTKEDILRKLAQYRYRSAIDHDFQIQVISQDTERPKGSPYSSFMQAYSSLKRLKSLVIAVITLLLPIMSIVCLEALQQNSDSNGGIINLNPGQTSRVMTSYVPALLMVFIAALYSRLDFETASLAPYRTLRSGKAVPQRSILFDIVDKIPIHALWLSIRTRHILPFLAVSAALTSSFLSILVSGLYSVSKVSYALPIHIKQQSTFNFTQNDLTHYDNDAAAITSLIQYSNLSYPQWTFDDLVFPEFQIDGFPKNSSITSIDIRLPAFRPRLNCSVIPRSAIWVSPDPINDIEPDSLLIHIGTNLSCSHATASWSQIFNIVPNNHETNIGLLTGLEWILFDSEAIIEAEPPGSGFNGDGTSGGGDDCPSVGFLLGKASAFLSPSATNKTDYTVSADVNMVACSQSMERVTADVRFEMPGLVLSTSKSPHIQEGSSQVFTGGPYSLWHYSLQQLQLGLSSQFSLPINQESVPFERFTEALARGKDGAVPFFEWGSNSSDVLAKLPAAASHVYATYLAQAISQAMRVPIALNESTNPVDNSTFTSIPTFNGSATTERTRLKQNRGSKIALQAVLAFMFTCALIIHVTCLWKWRENSRKRKSGEYAAMPPMLVEAPCSIAAKAILLAGSDMASGKYVMYREDSDDKELWAGLRFRMGWWWAEQGTQRRYGIDIEENEEGTSEVKSFMVPKGRKGDS